MAATVAQRASAPSDIVFDKTCEDSFLDDELLNNFIDDNDFFFPAEELDFVEGNPAVTNDPNDANDHASRYQPSKRVYDDDSLLEQPVAISPWTGRDVNQAPAETSSASHSLPSLADAVSSACPQNQLPALPSLNMAGLRKEGDRLKTAWVAQATARNLVQHSTSASDLERKRKAEVLATAIDLEATKRQRNREHARSTRRRRKQFVEDLQKQADLLSVEQEKLAAQGTDFQAISHRANIIAQKKVAVATFFDMRSTLETDRAKWAELVTEDFEFVLPPTPYRTYDVSEVKGNVRIVRGVDAMVADMASLAEMFANGSKNKSRSNQPKPGQRKLKSMTFSLSEEMLVIAGRSGMGQWSAKVKNVGANVQCQFDGMVKFVLADDNKIERLELVYDVKGFLQQLDAMTGNPAKVNSRNTSPTSVAAEVGWPRFTPPPTPRELAPCAV